MVAGSADSIERSMSCPPRNGRDAMPMIQFTEVNLREPRSLHWSS